MNFHLIKFFIAEIYKLVYIFLLFFFWVTSHGYFLSNKLAWNSAKGLKKWKVLLVFKWFLWIQFFSPFLITPYFTVPWSRVLLEQRLIDHPGSILSSIAIINVRTETGFHLILLRSLMQRILSETIFHWDLNDYINHFLQSKIEVMQKFEVLSFL